VAPPVCMFKKALLHRVTGQLATNQLAVSQVADWSTRRLVNSPKCLIYNLQNNSSKCYLGQITLFIRCLLDRVAVMVRVRFNVQIKYSNSMILKNSLSAS